jgi:FkbM family methyltransferase
MRVIGKLNRLTNHVLHQFGYEIGRLHRENPINLLELVISHLVLIGRPPNFVQVGANDGVQSDPLAKSIRKHKLSGLVVEPQPDIFRLLQENERNYPAITCVNAAIDRHDSARTMFRYRPESELPTWAIGLCSFDRRHLTKFSELAPFAHLIEEIEVKTISVRTLLANNQMSEIGVLQIDTEGYDFEIIKMFFAERVFPTVVNYEHCHLSGHDRVECEALLHDQGYRYVRYGRDALAMRRVAAEPDVVVEELIESQHVSSQSSPVDR